MNDLALMLAILVVNDLVVAGLLIGYNASRFYDQRRDCQERIAQANAEIMAMRKMRKTTEIQARTYGAVPVSRLIGGGE
jgi:cell division protein ZapA (FtsZ GTPase activity inhibitor)